MSTDWQRSMIALTWLVLVALIVAALSIARAIFIPIAMSIFLAFVLAPLVTRLHRLGLGRSLSVFATMIIVATGVGIAVLVIGSQLFALANTLPNHRDAITAKIKQARNEVVGDGSSRIGILINDVYAQIFPPEDEADLTVSQVGGSPTDSLGDYLSPVAEAVGQAALTLVLSVFILLKKEDLRNRMIRLLGDGKVTTTTRAVDDASTRISKYLLMQLFINSAFGGIITVGLFLLGVEYAVLWGFIASVMRYVPYLGTPLGLIPPVVFSFATADPNWGGGWAEPAAVLVLFVGLELLGNNVFEPWLFGKSMGVSEVAQLVTAALLAFLWGPIGLVLASPITVCLLVLGRHVRRFNSLEVILGDQPALAPPVAFYQRLAARDQDEAADIALGVARAEGIETSLDTVVVPALCIAHRDYSEGDLDRDDLQFVARSTREIVTEVSDLLDREPATTPAGRLADGPPDVRERVRVLVLPTRDEIDHVAADAFAVTLDPHRWEVRVAGDETLASEAMAHVDEFGPDVIILATLPPGGASHSRYLLGRLRVACPDIKVIVGRWGVDPTVPDLSKDESIGSENVDRTLAATRKRLDGMHAVLEKQRPGRLARKVQNT